MTCTCREWEHELFDGECPPVLPSRSCCGAEEVHENDVLGWCVNNLCIEYFCVCGAFQKMSSGPVFCGCDERQGWGRQHPEQRPKRPVPGGRLMTRKYRARQGRRR